MCFVVVDSRSLTDGFIRLVQWDLWEEGDFLKGLWHFSGLFSLELRGEELITDFSAGAVAIFSIQEITPPISFIR